MSQSSTLIRSGYIIDRRQDYVWFLGLPLAALAFALVSGQYLPGAALAAIAFMLLLGFADDVLDVPWRVRLFFFRLS